MTISVTEPTCRGAIHLLRAAAAHVERTLSKALEPHGITPAQFELLGAIARVEGTGGGCGELGRQMAAPGPDVTRMLDRLDTAGLVARKRDELDRRVVHAELTEAGRMLLSEVGPVVERAESAVFEGVAAQDVAQLARVLETIRATGCRRAGG